MPSTVPTEILQLPSTRSAEPWSLQPFHAGKLRWQVRSPFLSAPIMAILKNPDEYLAKREWQIKDRRIHTIARVPATLAGPASLVVRRLNYGKFIHRLRDTFRPTRAHRALQRGWLLEQAGVRTPRAIAAGVIRRWRLPQRAYLITEEVPGAEKLAHFMTQHGSVPRIVILRLADLLARLHESGFIHRDLKASNILLDAGLQPYLIDLDGVRRFKRIDQPRAVFDLGRLAGEFAGRPHTLKWAGLRFLKRYCQQRRLENSLRQFAGDLAAKLDVKRSQGRP
jgi:serine/threonine protein kinase